MIGAGIIATLAIIAIFADFLAPYHFAYTDWESFLFPPSWSHPFGTDAAGMDIFSRIIYGIRISLSIGLLIIAIAGTVGTTVGLASGYIGGRFDDLMMRITDIFMSFPSLLLAMVVTVALGVNLTNILLAASITYWPIYARLVRGSTLAEKEKEYVEAARAVGMGKLRIMFTQILPNVGSELIILMTMNMGGAILLTASMSFVGLGARPPTPEWGAMVSKGRNYLGQAPWVALFPGLAILVCVMGFMLLGDGLRDVTDPKLRR